MFAVNELRDVNDVENSRHPHVDGTISHVDSGVDFESCVVTPTTHVQSTQLQVDMQMSLSCPDEHGVHSTDDTNVLVDNDYLADSTDADTAATETHDVDIEALGPHCHTPRAKGDNVARNQLITVSVLCLAFMIAELVGGIISNSLALITDATHLASDLTGFLVSLFAIWMATKPPTARMSFGYYRAEVLGAMVSIIIIWIVTGILVYLAIDRIINPDYEIKADQMLIIASLGVAFNIIMGAVLNFGNCCGAAFAHGHSHGFGGGGHSHGHSHDHGDNDDHEDTHEHSHDHGHSNSHGHDHGDNSDHNHVHGHVDSHGDSHSDNHGDSHVDSHGDSHSDNHGDSHVDSHGDSHVHSHGDSHGDSHVDSHGDNHVHSPSDSHVHSDGDTHSNINDTTDGPSDGQTAGQPDGIEATVKTKPKAKRNINVRAALIHVIGDLIQSIGVFIAALIIKINPEYKLADPICTFVFSVLVLFTTAAVMRDAILVIMEAVPRDVNLKSMKEDLEKIEGVKAAHSLHVWALTMDKNAVAVHLAVEDEVESWDGVVTEGTRLLREEYQAFQSTIQVELFQEHFMTSCEQCMPPKGL